MQHNKILKNSLPSLHNKFLISKAIQKQVLVYF